MAALEDELRTPIDVRRAAATAEGRRAGGERAAREEAPRVIVVGSGLAGAAAASGVLERGRRVLILERAGHCGSRPVRASSGVSAAGSSLQRRAGVAGDSPDLFRADVAAASARLGGAGGPGAGDSAELAGLLCDRGGEAVEWLAESFGVDLTFLTRLSGHSVPRTHRGGDVDTGVAIKKALLQALQAAEESGAVQIVTRARVKELLLAQDGSCCGCLYNKGGAVVEERGPVILCTGGFGADFSAHSILARYRPDLLHLPTACGEHSTGDGLRMGLAAHARTIDLEWVQIQPTGLIRPDSLSTRHKRVAPESLRWAGGLLLNQEGDRFCNEVDSNEAVVCEMWRHKAPYRLVLNRAAAAEVSDLCTHFCNLGLMRLYHSGEALAKDMGIPLSRLEATHESHFQAARAANEAEAGGSTREPALPDGPQGKACIGKQVFRNVIPGSSVKAEPFYVSIVTPVICQCLGGLEVDGTCAVAGKSGAAIPGLFAAGEVVGGLRGSRGLGGNTLLESVVLGRTAGHAAAESASSFQVLQPASVPPTAAVLSPAAAAAADSRSGPANEGGKAAVAEGGAVTDLRARVAAGQLETWLEKRLTPGALQDCLSQIHASGGDFDAAVRDLCCRLLRSDSEAAEWNGPVLQVRARDPAHYPLPTAVTRAGVPDAGSPPAEVPFACVHCRLPATLEVRRGGPQADAQAYVGSAAEVGDDLEEHSCAYATLLYGNKAEYLLGALVIGWSLKASGSEIDRLLLHTDDVPTKYLELLRHYWDLQLVQYLEGSQKLYKDYNRSRFKAVFTKLQALSCTEYEKILMLDLDMLIRENLDELFKLEAPAALKRSSGKEQPEHGGHFYGEDLWRNSRDDMCSGINAGVMLLRPDQQVYERMVAEIKDPRHPEHIGTYGPEQDYLSRFYSTFATGAWTHLHARYNYQLMLPDDYVSSAHRAINVQRDVAVAHYSGPRVKPWKVVQEGRDMDLSAAALERLLGDDSLREILAEPVGGGSRGGGGSRQSGPRERVMDGVLVVEDQDASNFLPEPVQAVMWEWVLGLRSACKELREAGIDPLAIIREVQYGH